MEHEVKVQHREPVLVAAKRVAVTLRDIGQVVGSGFGEIYPVVAAQHAGSEGPPFVIYHGMPDGETPFDIEICAPLQKAMVPPAGWALSELPAGTFASLVHVGPYDSVGAGYDAITAWIAAKGFATAGPPREVYLSDPSTPPDQIRTIIEFPVAAVPLPVTAG
jgi:effector-binding domain-containing protein